MKNFNSFFNSLVAMPKRLAMVLTVLFTVGVGSMLGAALGDGYEKVTNISTLSAGDRVVLYCDANSVGVTGWNNNKDATVATSGWVEYLVEAASGGVYLKDEIVSKYIASPGSSNQFLYGTKAVCTVDANGVLKCNSRLLYANGTNYRMYSSIQSSYKAFYVYKVLASTPSTPCTVTFHTTATKEEEKKEASAGEGVTPPIMEEECGEWEFQGWSELYSDDEESTTKLDLVVTLDEEIYYPTKNINLYPVYTKSEGGGGTEYVLTDIGEISSGDIFVFADASNYALTNNNGTSSAVGVKQITVSNSKITSTVDATIEWQLTGNNTNGYTFYPGTGTTTWLYCNTTASSSNNNNMRVGTGDRKLFVVNNNGYLVTNDTYTDRYLSRYNTQDFRGYTNTNTNPVKPKLYKKTAGSTTYYYSYPQCTTETTVTLQPNGGTGTAQVLETTDGSLTLPKCDFTYEGYRFVGWNTKANGTGTTYQPSAKYTPTENPATLYAKWAKEYTVTYNANGGTTTCEDNKKYIAGEQVTVCTSAPTRDSYTFNGWSYSPSVAITDGQFTMPENDVTITAQWTSNKTATSLSWSPTSYSATIDVDNTFPTLSISPTEIKTGVTYSSSNEAVATIDANTGDISLVAAGTTTITATFTETNTHAGSTASYTLTVNPSNCRWVEVTDNTTLEDGDEVVIAMANGENIYALPNNKGTSTPDGILLDILDGNKINTVGDYLKWTVEKTEGNYIFHPNGNNAQWLYCINSDDGVRVGTGAAKAFILDPTTGYLANTQTNPPRYLRLGRSDNINYVWRCYTTNTAGQTLKFYKKVCLDSETFWVDYNLANVTCTNTPPHSQIAKSETLALNFEAATDYALPDNVTVTGATPSWNKATGTLTISNPTANVTITIEALKLHTINWMVGSNSVLTEEVANATGVTQTPATPANNAIGNCANAFMGWTETPLGSAEGQSAPADLCTAAQMKSKHTNLTGDKTFYAVFATATTTPGTSTTTNKTYTHTITSKTWDANGAKTLSNISWTLSNNGDYYGYDGTKGQQVGSGSKPAKSMTLTTSGFASASKITSVTINTSGASDIKANVSVKVGGTSYFCNSNTSPSITTTATAYEFTGNSIGEVVISWSQTSSKAIYFKSITVVYSNTTTTPDVTTYSNYVTNCCALAPATNLTVSGTTSNTATLTWTAPSPTTGITKLQVRNADNDAVVVDDVAVGTTTATITELTECTKYNYYVASVGDCEVFSNTVTAQPFGSAKTVYYEYNGGSGTETSFTTNCEEQEVTLPTATRAGYDFNGWYTAATGGTKVGDAGGTYNPTTSSITLYAQWTKKIYIISFHANGGEGTMANQCADENDVVAQLNANQFTRDGYAFVGWNTTAGGTGTAYADQATNITLTQNRTLYAQWAAIVTLNDAGNVTTTHPATAGGSITLENGANACDPYEFVGWTSVATADWNEGIKEPTLVTSPYKPTQPTTLYAVYKIQSEGNANAFKLSFEGSNGKTYYVDEYSSGSSPLRGYSNITKEEAATFIRTKMYPNDDTRYYVYMEEKGEYLYYNGYFNTTSNTPDENQGWVFHTVGDKIKLQSTYSYDPDYLSFSDRDQETINMGTNASGSEFNMLSAVTSTYVASPLCNQEIEIIFETGNGDFVDNAPATNPLTVSRGDVITLPTCEYPGYEFMGWLKDEQQLDPSDIIGTYYTGDYTVDGVSQSITFYAYYKVIPEEVEFTGKDDVELLMYYYDGTENYYYAVSHAAERGELSSKQNCFNATTWTFTNVGNMQYHIQDETGKYLGAYSDGDNDLILSATPKVWTFTEVNGLWKMVCENSPSRALMYISEGNRFTNAAITNEGNGAYNYITLGICPYPTYTTNPVLSQGFSITNTAMVTSASGQKVKATSALTLETRNIELPCTFTISAPNITFYDNTGAEVTELESSAASEQFELHFAYKPTAENTIEYPTVTITDDEMKTYTIKNRIYARSLPATFAIVAKVGNLWYALPSQGLNSTAPPAAYPVEVDNVADPTAVAAVPANADWSLRQVYEASRVDATKDRFVANGENFVFVNNEGTPKALNASASGNYLLTDAQYSGYYETNPGLYEWTPTTTDLETYTLTNVNRGVKMSINTSNVFGVHSQNVVTTQVRFLPIQNRYTPMAAQVVEWKDNSVVIMYNGNPTQTAQTSINGTNVGSVTLANVQKDIAVYELPADGLGTKPNQTLSVTIGSEKLLLPTPYMVNSEVTDEVLLGSSLNVQARRDIAKVSNLVILKGGKLTSIGAKTNPYTFRNVTIYGGGTLVVSADKGFGANTLTMRVGGVENGQYKNLYPQLQLKGTLTNTSGQINLDYLTTNDFYYPLSVPYSVIIADIQYPVDIYGANVASDNTGSFQFKYYDGAERAAGKTGWIVLNETANPTLNPNTGYAIWGIPKKINGTRQKFGIHRLPLKQTAEKMMENEKKSHETTVNVYNGSNRDSDNGWNYLGNPYLSHYGDFTTDDKVMKLGKLVWDEAQGAWLPTDTEQRYVVFTNDCQNYIAELASTTAIPAFSAFFIQADQGGAINFNSPNEVVVQSLVARRSEEESKEITTGIILSGEKHSDRTGLLIADQFTEAYEFNADLSKFDNQDMNLYTISPSGKLAFMAINEELAKQTIPLGYSVSTDGMYSIAFDEQRYNRNDIYALYLIDYDRNETTNLLHMDYNFYSETGAHAERFALQVAFAPSTTTDVEYTQVGDVLLSREGNNLRLDNLPSDATVTVYDAVGHLVEQHTASQLLQLTLQKGYYLLHIGNNQNSVVIDTFIP